jgi:hypothetical protein
MEGEPIAGLVVIDPASFLIGPLEGIDWFEGPFFFPEQSLALQMTAYLGVECVDLLLACSAKCSF